jgi:beta-glucanase (GH16 family)
MRISTAVSLLRRTRVLGGVAGTVALASSLFVVVGSTENATAASSGPTAGLTLAFTANFGGNALNTSQWDTCYLWFTPSTGCTNYGNSQEEEWYLPSQDQVSGGELQMVASATPTAGTTKTGASKTYPYRSGMVTTDNSFSFTYGYVQIVAKLPGGSGTWPALWLVPKATVWPPEIDIMENWGTPTTFRGTYHWTTKNPRQQGYTIQTGVDLADSFNTYGLLWQPGALTWYFDTKAVASYSGAGVSTIPMFLIANLAIDGTAPSPSDFDLKSVQVYDGTTSSRRSPSPPRTRRAPASVIDATPSSFSPSPSQLLVAWETGVKLEAAHHARLRFASSQ